MSRSVRYDFDPFELTGTTLPKGADRRQILADIADYTREQVLSYVGDRKSPVKGHGAFKSLSKDYAKLKKDAGHPAVPNLLFEGDMLDALQAKPVGKRVRLEIAGAQGDKADGHNNHSGESELPLRRFIPTEDETFKAEILDGIRRIIEAGGKN